MMMPSKKTEVLTVRQYARREEITLQTVYRRIWQKQIPARRIYGRWVIPIRGQVGIEPKK